MRNHGPPVKNIENMKNKQALLLQIMGCSAIAFLCFLAGRSNSNRSPTEATQRLPITNSVSIPVKVRVTNLVTVFVTNLVEIPHPLSDEEWGWLGAGSNYWNAQKIESRAGSLSGIEGLHLKVFFDPKLKEFISEEDVQTRFELILRQNGVPLDEKARFPLMLVFDGALIHKGNSGREVVAEAALKAGETAPVLRFEKGEIRAWTMPVVFWETTKTIWSESGSVRETVLEVTRTFAEHFANDFLSAKETRNRQ